MGPEPENSAPSAKGRPFQKGKSGNPGGRPKTIGIVRDLARKHTKDALDTLITLAGAADSDSVRVAACKEILDRGWGKAPQAITGADGEKLALSISINLGGEDAK